jgi:hypothetical protein
LRKSGVPQHCARPYALFELLNVESYPDAAENGRSETGDVNRSVNDYVNEPVGRTEKSQDQSVEDEPRIDASSADRDSALASQSVKSRCDLRIDYPGVGGFLCRNENVGAIRHRCFYECGDVNQSRRRSDHHHISPGNRTLFSVAATEWTEDVVRALRAKNLRDGGA